MLTLKAICRNKNEFGEKLQEIVRNFLNKFQIKNERILVGYSTGCDSTVLLHTLNSLKNDFNLKIIAIHLNHGWRKISDEEAVFAQNFCKENDIDFYTEKLPPNDTKTETLARELRYNFFENCAKKFNSKYIFLAHNKNDNIETLVYRVIKGTGLDGLCAIPQNRDVFYRPLLEVSRDEIEKYAQKYSLKFNEDLSNKDTKYRRNFIRHKILPLFKEINATCENSIFNLIKVANLESEIVCDKISEIEKQIFENNKIKTQDFLKLKSSYQIKILQKYIKNDLKNPNFSKIEQILNFIKDTVEEKQDPKWRKYKRFSINSKVFLYVNKKEIFKGN